MSDEPVAVAGRWVDELRAARPDAWRARPRAVCAALCSARIAGTDPDADWAGELLGPGAAHELLAAPLAHTFVAAIACGRRVPVLEHVLEPALELFATGTAPAATIEAQLVAHAAGLAPAPTLPPRPADMRLPLADSEVTALAARASAATGFGTVSGAYDGDLAELVTGLAAHYLRAYDLALASTLLRTLAHLDAADSIAARRCADFLRLQQRADGSFGYFGPEDLDLTASLPGFDPDLDLHLPVTLSCMIALSEAGDPAWRLVHMA